MPTSDKFRDECGVVAIHAHPEAEKLAYLGLYALQHRGQESAGIVTSDGERLRQHKAMGLVADIFSHDVLASLRGVLAIGHTRYSTAGDSALLNAQPIMVQSNKGTIAIAHNGNLVNAHAIRAKLEGQGSIFQTNSDTEVLVHLIALSREQTLPDAIADALRRVEGAFSLVMISRDRIFAARDPRGFRPLAMGRIPALTGEKKDTVVFASETCAFDLLGATYERDVKPGELVIVGPEGISSRFYSPSPAQSSCIFEHVYFSRPDSLVFGRSVDQSRDAMGRQLAREAPVDADIVVPVPDSGNTAAIGYAAESGIPFRLAPHPQPLRRTHFHRAATVGPRLRREAEAERRSQPDRRQASDSGRRLHCARHHQQEDRPHDSQRGREGSPHADFLPADHLALLLRSGYAFKERTHRRQQDGRCRFANSLSPTHSPISRWKVSRKLARTAKKPLTAPPAIREITPPR